METLRQDLRYALRSFWKTPGFTALALVTLAIGIGVNATVFGFVNSLLLKPAPLVRDPGSLVSVFTSDFSSGPYGTSSYPDYLSMKAGAPAFRALAASSEGSAAIRIGETVERVGTMAVSGEFFELLGVRPAIGRALTAEDEQPAAPPVAVIGHTLWQRVFGGASSAVGAQVVVDGRSATIVGVAPDRFEGLDLGAAFELWTPLQARNDPAARGNRGLSVVGRLADGASMRQAQGQLDAVATSLAAMSPGTNRGTLARPDDPRPMIVVPHTRLDPRFRSEVATIGATLMASVGLVLLIACANVAGLLLSRATARSREVAVRLALGATRGRVLRQMLTESLVLGATGGLLGLLFALWTADALPSFFPAEQARLLDARVDWAVVLFTAAIALASGLACGLAPALHGMRSPSALALRGSDGRTGDARKTVSARNVLVVAQVAVASVLLVSAMLLTRSLFNALQVDPGFSTRQAVLLSIELPSTLSREEGHAYYESVVTAVGAVPGVERASLARVVPVAGGSRRLFRVPGYVPTAGEDMELHVNSVHRGYFETMGFVPIDGRLFQSSDAGRVPIVVVNDVLADRYFGGHAVGQRMQGGKTVYEIVGVVRAQRRSGLQDPPTPVVFYQLESDFVRNVTLVAKTSGAAPGLTETIRRTAAGVNRDVAIFRATTLEAHLAEAVTGNRLTAVLVAACGAMAFALAVVGVYGIVAYAVVRRTREIGVRVALGARPAQVLGLLVRESGRVIAAGVALGVAAGLASTRLLESMLYGVSATDPVTFVAVPLAVSAAAMLASCVPAARALRISPVAALRHE
jgi:predicted permease